MMNVVHGGMSDQTKMCEEVDVNMQIDGGTNDKTSMCEEIDGVSVQTEADNEWLPEPDADVDEKPVK